MQIPREGDYVAIQSYKHDGHLHRTWRETMVLKTSENELLVVMRILLSQKRMDVVG
jgi:Uncharacterized domain/protein associated with RNAses G and E